MAEPSSVTYCWAGSIITGVKISQARESIRESICVLYNDDGVGCFLAIIIIIITKVTESLCRPAHQEKESLGRANSHSFHDDHGE